MLCLRHQQFISPREMKLIWTYSMLLYRSTGSFILANTEKSEMFHLTRGLSDIKSKEEEGHVTTPSPHIVTWGRTAKLALNHAIVGCHGWIYQASQSVEKKVQRNNHSLRGTCFGCNATGGAHDCSSSYTLLSEEVLMASHFLFLLPQRGACTGEETEALRQALSPPGRTQK